MLSHFTVMMFLQRKIISTVAEQLETNAEVLLEDSLKCMNRSNHMH